MYYERMRMMENPYKLWIGSMQTFGEHRHADFEIAYCFEGGFELKVNNERYKVSPGEMIVIPPMVAHASAAPPIAETRALCAIFGASFFGTSFGGYRNFSAKARVIRLGYDNERYVKMRSLLDEMVFDLGHPSATSHLANTGNLYKLSAHIIDELSSPERDEKSFVSDITKYANIDRALELIYSGYMRDITVEEAAAAAGYSKSNFCKIFKSIVGESFHKTLNTHRVASSYSLLRETSMQISDIAAEVGFPEAKTYCRVFKEITDMTPREYRMRAGGEV